MQYILLFPYGEDGQRENTHYTLKEGAKWKRKDITMLEYYENHIQQHTNLSKHLLVYEKPKLQFIALAYILLYKQTGSKDIK